MISRTNIHEKLTKRREKRISSDSILAEVSNILEKNEEERQAIKDRISSPSKEAPAALKPNLLNGENIYHIDDIKSICIDYRLRFLDSHFFKGDFPEEAITRIRALENKHDTTLSGLKIMAPSKLLKLENADDPLLFAPLGNDYYYLIHKWGNDLHPFRKLLMWPYKSFDNLVFTVFLVSLLLTAITPVHLLSKVHGMQEYVLLFLFMFKAVGGIVLYYGFAKGKNFNTAIWDSKYYNA